MRKLVATLATGVMIAGASFMTVSADTYEVEKGDSLWTIADEFDTTVQELVDINELNTTMIQPSQELMIDNDTTYIVEKGDTLSKISKQHDVSVSDIKEWNQLDSHIIVVGQELEIKNAETASSSDKGQADTKQKKSNQQQEKKEKKSDDVADSKSNESSNEAPEGKTISVSSTAYTATCHGCSGVTSTGVDLNADPNAKVIAVDPTVIPLGTKVYVEGYGYATAADTGGAINGNKIDVHVPTKSEAQNWGVRDVNVTIVE